MRHGSSNRRPRGRSGGPNRKPGQQRSQVFDSNGPDVRIRGTAYQVTEKYQALAKDAASSGDYVASESYLQHAEHYQRIISSWGLEDRPAPQKQDVEMKDNAPQEKSNAPVKAKASNDKEDLSLPSSILGESANKARTPEKADAGTEKAEVVA
jgi:hypothetical protein